MSGQLASGDEAGARSTLADAQGNARDARSSTRGPGWWLSARISGVAPNVTAVCTVAEVTDDLASDVLPDVVTATTTLAPQRLRPVKGRIDLAPIRGVAPALVQADQRLQRQSDRVARIETGELAPQIAAPVSDLQTKLAGAAALSDRASRAVQLLPSMLGDHGPRTYLVMFQNNAELRSTGGIPGAFATVTARDGKVTLGRQGDAGTIGRFDEPVLPLTAQEKALFGKDLGRYAQDVNFTPDFPRSAELIQAMWHARGNPRLDGVISTDPVALSYLLRGTGPVALGGGRTLTADQAVPLLLNQVYADIADPGQQNAFFAAVTEKVFGAVVSGQGQPRELLDGLVTSASERRILLWSDHPREQELLAPTRLAGALPRQAGEAPQVGVYLNDGSEAKLDYYLDYAVDVRSTGCRAGRQHLAVTLSLRSEAPRNPRLIADYVGSHAPGVARGTMRTTLYIYAPVGGRVAGAAVDGKEQELSRRTHLGRDLVAQSIDLRPGRKSTLTYQMVTGKGQTHQAELQVTPGARSDGIGTVTRSACS